MTQQEIKQQWRRKLVRAAMRENNQKRSYLIVNPSQGKHVPVAPSDALSVFDCLADKVKEMIHPEEPVLIIAFAETATAIGAAVAAALPNPTYLMHTTREEVADTDFLFFSEVHSHATEQRLALRGLYEALKRVKHIVFVEDEVTTGNTIWNLVERLRGIGVPDHVQFGIASLLNGMLPEHKGKFDQEGIWTTYLLHTDNAALEKSIGRYAYDGPMLPVSRTFHIPVERQAVEGGMTPRCVLQAREYERACGELAQKAAALAPRDAKRVLVLGTEECMYPGLLVGRALEADRQVRFHATTRSPILVSSEEEYPLHRRNALCSLYDQSRITYLYNLESYDFVLVVTDTGPTAAGWESLCSALEQAGNRAVTFLEWRS